MYKKVICGVLMGQRFETITFSIRCSGENYVIVEKLSWKNIRFLNFIEYLAKQTSLSRHLKIDNVRPFWFSNFSLVQLQLHNLRELHNLKSQMVI